MDILLATAQAPTLYQWLCIAIVGCAITMPKGLIAMDRMMARQPERSEWSGCSYVRGPRGATQPSIWPRVMTAIGGAFWIGALLTLVFLCQQLTP
jgi:hypothetical protein